MEEEEELARIEAGEISDGADDRRQIKKKSTILKMDESDYLDEDFE